LTIDGYCTLGVDREYDTTEQGLLQAMDAAGVDRAVIAPADRFLAVLNREGNERMRLAARAHPTRFIPACSANPWYGEAAVEEVAQAVAEGARILVLHPLVQGFAANDELVFPLLEFAATERIPVYFHTGPPGNSTPWQIADLAVRYPALALIMGHCGATDFWNDVIVAASAAPNIYLESSLARPFHFARYVGAVGRDRGIMGSWAPVNDLPFEWEQMRAVLSADDFSAVSGRTLSQLLQQRGPL